MTGVQRRSALLFDARFLMKRDVDIFAPTLRFAFGDRRKGKYVTSFFLKNRLSLKSGREKLDVFYFVKNVAPQKAKRFFFQKKLRFYQKALLFEERDLTFFYFVKKCICFLVQRTEGSLKNRRFFDKRIHFFTK